MKKTKFKDLPEEIQEMIIKDRLNIFIKIVIITVSAFCFITPIILGFISFYNPGTIDMWNVIAAGILMYLMGGVCLIGNWYDLIYGI